MADKPNKNSSPSNAKAEETDGKGKGKVVVKKVRAYPFAANVEYKGIKKPVQILKLALVGCWANLGKTVVQVGTVYNVDFELPVLRDTVQAQAKVLRTTDRVMEVQNQGAVERLAEFQFIKLTVENKEKINRFLAAINQVS